MTRTVRWLALITGVACVAIGLFHLTLGIASVPGEGSAGATVDSRERFYGAIFIGYGLAWVYAVRQDRDGSSLIRWLSGIFLLGGLGRLLSLAVQGRPQWFQLALTALELALPLLFFWLVSAPHRKTPHRRAPHKRTSRPAPSSHLSGT